MAQTGDGSNNIQRDSKIGLVSTFVVGVVLDATISAVSNVDTSTWTGWWVPFVSLGLATGGGWLATYKAKRAKSVATSSRPPWQD